jgi:threonine/homoserine/homoserine lactone efflux protein
MLFSSWLLFVGVTFAICGSPGPNMLHMMAMGVQHGLRKTFYSMIGCFTAVLLLIAGSVAGVGIILASSPNLFMIVRYLGAAYLIYLGIQAWRSPISVETGLDAAYDTGVTGRHLARKGFLVGISNPKALLFAAAFFPQFINPDEPQVLQMLILLITFTVLEFAWYAAYALGGSKLARYMGNPKLRKQFNRGVGGLFACFGTALLFQHG